MNWLSSDLSPALLERLSIEHVDESAYEADLLGAWIEQHAATLRHGQPPQGELAFQCRVIQTDRNVVWRVRGTLDWYLKMPSSGDSEAIAREIIGAQVVDGALTAHDEYCHPGAVRASLDPAYLLVQQVPGRPIHQQLYRASLMPWGGRREQVVAGFTSLGCVLAAMHRWPTEWAIQPANRPIRPVLEALAATHDTRDRTAVAINRWIQRLPAEDGSACVLHGNLKMENILLNNRRVCLIDFENSGLGTAEEDLSWVLSQLALVQTVRLLPKALASQAARALLAGYRSGGDLVDERLQQAVAMRVARYYLEMTAGKFGWPRIAGFPVVLDRVVTLVNELLQGQGIGVVKTI